MPVNTAMMGGGLGVPFMQVAQQQPMMQQPMMQMMQNPMMQQPMMPMMPQMQNIPMMAMTPMGPVVVGYQQMGLPQMPNLQANMFGVPANFQMETAMPQPAVGSQAGEASDGALQTPGLIGAAGEAPATQNAMDVVETPFGYAIRVPSDALQQPDLAAQLAQMQQALIQSQMPQTQQIYMPTNPYAGLYATPFGYLAMNNSAGQLGSPMMMNVGYQPMGMGGVGMVNGGQGGIGFADMLQIMAFINSQKPQRRARLFERIAERREARQAASGDCDPVTQLMQAWTTPHMAPNMALRMPAQNAYPYGHFGAQGMPISTANYGGYHNFYMGNTTYPGLY